MFFDLFLRSLVKTAQWINPRTIHHLPILCRKMALNMHLPLHWIYKRWLNSSNSSKSYCNSSFNNNSINSNRQGYPLRYLVLNFMTCLHVHPMNGNLMNT